MSNFPKKADSGPLKRPGKTSKLAKMNEQERARYLERKMAEEEESKKRKEDMVTCFMKYKLGHEQKYYHLNNAKVIEQWRVILRQCKNKELQSDVKTLQETFTRALERKASLITMLMKELTEAENQYNMAFRSQRELINDMNEIHRNRLDDILRIHDTNTGHVLNLSYREKELSAIQETNALKYLGDVNIASNQRHEILMEEIKNVYQEIRDECRNKNMEEKQAIQIFLEETMEKLWKQMQNSIIAHNSGTEEKRRIYMELMDKDKKGLSEVVENNKKIVKLSDDSLKLKDTLSDVQDIEDRKLSGLRREKEDLMSKLQEMRKTVSSKRANDAEREIRQISVLVNDLQQKVQRIETFQGKLRTLVKGCHVPMSCIMEHRRPLLELEDQEPEDKILTYINENQLHLSNLKDEKKKLQNELRGLNEIVQRNLTEIAALFR